MSKINTELFIARRISRRSGMAKGVMVRMATVSVAIGMAVMIVALSVIGGFKNEITEKLTGFGADIRIFGQSGGAYEDLPIAYDKEFAATLSAVDGVASVLPYVTKSGIIRTPQAINGVVLKGLPKEYDVSFFADRLIGGELPRLQEANRDLMISRLTADLLDFEIGDKVEMMFIGEDNSVKRDIYKICGIYSTGMDDFDRVTAVTGIENLRRLNRWDVDMATGYEIRLSDFGLLDNVAAAVDDSVRKYNANHDEDSALHAVSIKQEYMGIFDWLATLDVNGAVIIIIMLVVALLNMVSALLIILLERTSMIGVLKALGMSNMQLQRMFLIRASDIIFRGMFYGNLAGVGIAMIQKLTGVIKLDSSGYLLSKVPVLFDWEWWVELNLGVPIVLLLLLTVPVMVVSAIRPEQTIRYQ